MLVRRARGTRKQQAAAALTDRAHPGSVRAAPASRPEAWNQKVAYLVNSAGARFQEAVL